MNLAIRGIDGLIEWGDSFLDDKHKDLRADYLLANPPFNMEDWGFSRVQNDVRWKYGSPPTAGARKQSDGSTIMVDGGNANFAWIQHFIHHLAPAGMAGFVMANGSMSTSTNAELAIRQGIIEDDLVDCMIALPGQLFYTTQIPVCLWFLTRSKAANPQRGLRARQGETLFMDARKLGTLTDRIHRELSEEDIARITRTYHAWRGEEKDGQYQDEAGFCKAATLEDIRKNHHVLTPGRYVGIEEEDDDGIPFEEKMEQLTANLGDIYKESKLLDEKIQTILRDFGYDIEI
jgi:type I restriction enzyme M protein